MGHQSYWPNTNKYSRKTTETESRTTSNPTSTPPKHKKRTRKIEPKNARKITHLKRIMRKPMIRLPRFIKHLYCRPPFSLYKQVKSLLPPREPVPAPFPSLRLVVYTHARKCLRTRFPRSFSFFSCPLPSKGLLLGRM